MTDQPDTEDWFTVSGDSDTSDQPQRESTDREQMTLEAAEKGVTQSRLPVEGDTDGS